MCINMPVNSTSSDALPSNASFNTSIHLTTNCFTATTSIYVFCGLSSTTLLLLPVSIFVLWLGYQQWRPQHSTSKAAPSHSDIFIYHSIVMQVNEFLGFNLYFCGSYFQLREMRSAGLCVWSVTSLGQALLHLLTCVERYLAVVHPVTYMSLKHASGVRIRNISTGCVWLLSLAWSVFLFHSKMDTNLIFFTCIMVFSSVVILFCSVSVLCALKRPGPGEVGRNREQTDQSKQKAFHTIVAILGLLLFRFGGNVIATIVYSSIVLSPSDACKVVMSVFGFDMPSRLVLPLLFLHRAGKLPCIRQNTESERGQENI